MAGEGSKYPYEIIDNGKTLVLFINPRLITPGAVYSVISMMANKYRFMIDGSLDGVVKLYIRSIDGSELDEETAWKIYTELLNQMAYEIRASEGQRFLSRLVSPAPGSHASSVGGR